MDGNAGFTSEAFNAIAEKVKQGKQPVVNIVLDEIAIREHLQWANDRFYGYTDIGFPLETQGVDELPLARNALVFMATGRYNWGTFYSIL